MLDYELEQTRKRTAEEWWESDELSHLVEETIDDVINGCFWNYDFVEMENAEVDEGEDMINLDDDGRICSIFQ